MQKVNLNLIPGGVRPVINVSQYDEGRQFQLAIYNGSASYDLTGKTVVIEVGKRDGNGCAYGSTDLVNNIPVVAVSGNMVTITTPKQMTAVAGDNSAELKISDSSAEIGTLNFILECEQSALSPDTPISDTQIPALEDLASQNAQKAEAAVAHYPYIDDTTKNWFVWDAETGAFVDTGVRAQGIDGEGSVKSVNNVSPDADGDVSLGLSNITAVPITTANGGTGNSDGYIRTGVRSGSLVGTYSTIEGNNNVASGTACHVEGQDNSSLSGISYAHVGGIGNTANVTGSTVIGKYANNDGAYGTPLFVVGNGSSSSAKSSAFHVNLSGDATVQGKLFKGSVIGNPSDAFPSANNNLAPAEKTRTMTAAHAANSFLYVVSDDQFYQVGSTALSVGATLTPGTNADAKTIAEVLEALNSDLTPEVLSITPTHGMVKVVKCGKVVNVIWDTGGGTVNIPTGWTVLATGLPKPYTLYPNAQGSPPAQPLYFAGSDGLLHNDVFIIVFYDGSISINNASGSAFKTVHCGANLTYITRD